MRFVRSGYLLKLEYALRCFVESDYPYWAYKLAREYVERYQPQYGSGLIPESVPMLLEIAQFWCQYYFGQNLREKFPDLIELEAGVMPLPMDESDLEQITQEIKEAFFLKHK